jgi:hypothetical protein
MILAQISSGLGRETLAYWRCDNSLSIAQNHTTSTHKRQSSVGGTNPTRRSCQIHEDMRPISVWTRAEANIHVFDPCWRARARPGHPTLRARVERRPTPRPHPHRAYKAAQDLDRTPPRALSPAQPRVRRTFPKHEVPPPAKPPELRPPWPAHPSHPQSSISARLASPETREAPQALRPSRASPEDPNHLAELLPLTGECESGKSLRHSPIPPMYHLCVTGSSLPRQPIGLSRCEQAGILAADELPRLRTWTDHLWRRPVPRRDRRNLPDLPRRLTEAISSSVSPSVVATVPIEEGSRVRFMVTPGVFLRCQWISAIGTRGLVCKETRKKMPGTPEQSRFSFSFRISNSLNQQ